MKNNVYFILPLMVLCLLPSFGAFAQTRLEIERDKRMETISLTLPEVTPHKVFTLGNPHRLVVDVPALGNNPKISLPDTYKSGVIKAVRVGRFDPKTSRIVFDLTSAVSVKNVEEETGRASPTLVIQILSQQAAKEEAAPKKPDKPLIAIDAGHGGVDPGAIGPSGTREKNVVLEYARQLKAKLLKTGRYRVILTREDDRFIILRKRFEIARKAKADVFISLHADSAPDDDARGLSVYSLSEQASDAEAEALAARENKADVLAGIDLSEESQDVADILISLAQRETNNYSAMLGDFMVVSMQNKVKLLPNPHRFAGFAVLKAPDIPSVLIETGFISHPSEEKLLKSKAHRDKVIDGIVRGLDAYFKYRKKTEGE